MLTQLESRPQMVSLRPCNATAALQVATAIGWTALALALSTDPRTGVWACGQLAWAVVPFPWLALLHEAGHGTLFRWPAANRLTGHLASVLAFVPFTSWKPIHNLHHRWTGWQDLDPTTASLVPRPLGRLEGFVLDACWRLGVPLVSLLYRATYWRPSRVLPAVRGGAARARVVLNGLLLLALYAALAWAVGPLELLLLAGPGLLVGFALQDALILSQHTHIPMQLSRGADVKPVPAPAQAPYTRSLGVPRWVSRGVLFGFEAHELHHVRPQVPGYALHRLDEPAPRTCPWWRWLVGAKRLPGRVLMFQNEDQTEVVL